jgi:hypothetical protein
MREYIGYLIEKLANCIQYSGRDTGGRHASGLAGRAAISASTGRNGSHQEEISA